MPCGSAQAASVILACCWMVLHLPCSTCLPGKAGAGSSVEVIPDSGPELSASKLRLFRAAASALDPELMGHAPEVMDSAYKNPCWHSRLASSDKPHSSPNTAATLRCLPYVFLSSFHTGTDLLAKKLMQHPSISMVGHPLSPNGILFQCQ